MASCVGQGRRGSLGAGGGYCRPLVRPSWCRGSAAAPIRCSGAQVSIWTTSRTIFAVWPLSLEPRRSGLAGVAVPQPATPTGYLTGRAGAVRPHRRSASRLPRPTKDAVQARRLAIEVRFAAMVTQRNGVRLPHPLPRPPVHNERSRPTLGLIKLKLLLRVVEERTDVQEWLIGGA
jgi:hypothetical protein